jgi:hypothetical protein
MSTRSKWALALACALNAWGQAPRPATSVKVNFPEDSPVSLISANWDESRTEARGGALVLDLHTALVLRNTTQQRIRGITLLVQAQEATAGGKGSVSVPSLDVRGGEVFPIRIDLRLLRPLLSAGGPLAEVKLDGVLFDDLTFFGPNRLNSRRAMTVWELEARRDRKQLRSVLEAKGPEGLRREMLDTLARLADQPTVDVQVLRRGRVTAMAARERPVQFAFLHQPDSPIEPIRGVAGVEGGEARRPQIEVVNRSKQPVRYFEIGWIIQDRGGRQFLAGSVPASETGLRLAPGARGQIVEDAALRFTRQPGEPVSIAGMTGFVSQVEFSDGTFWIPSRSAPLDPSLRSVLAPSAEEQRLADLYRKKGLTALINELKK